MTLRDELIALRDRWNKNGEASRFATSGNVYRHPTPAGAAMLVCAEELDALLAKHPEPEPPVITDEDRAEAVARAEYLESLQPLLTQERALVDKLTDAGEQCVKEMCNARAPRNSFTDANDRMSELVVAVRKARGIA